MRLKVCRLTKHEAYRQEHQNRRPDCAHHDHLPLEEGFRMVRQQRARWVRVGWSIVQDVLHWQSKMSGGVKVMQLVEGDQVRRPTRYRSVRP